MYAPWPRKILERSTVAHDTRQGALEQYNFSSRICLGQTELSDTKDLITAIIIITIIIIIINSTSLYGDVN